MDIEQLYAEINLAQWDFMSRFNSFPDLCIVNCKYWTTLFIDNSNVNSCTHKYTGDVRHEQDLINGDQKYYFMGMRFIKSGALDENKIVLTIYDDMKIDVSYSVGMPFLSFCEKPDYTIRAECQFSRLMRLMVIDLK